MKRIMTLASLALLLSPHLPAQGKTNAYILPFIIEFKGAANAGTEKVTADFSAMLGKLEFFEVVERSRYESILKDVGMYGRKVYDDADLRHSAGGLARESSYMAKFSGRTIPSKST
jgi:hypothetical protein